jgi:hypothetical protein
MELVILIGVLSAIAAGFACAFEHGYAERHGWGALERYAAGGLTWLAAFAPVLYAALAIEWASLLLLIAGVILGTMGGATWASYQKPIAMPDEDELEAKINKALGEK